MPYTCSVLRNSKINAGKMNEMGFFEDSGGWRGWEALHRAVGNFIRNIMNDDTCRSSLFFSSF